MIIKHNRFYVQLSYKDRIQAKLISGYRWHPDMRMWSFPVECSERFAEFFPTFKVELYRKLEDMKKGAAQEEQDKIDEFNALHIDGSAFKRTPFPHQIDMIKSMLVEHQHALLCEMGTGKTQAIINLFEILKNEKKVISNCLIICPNTVKDNWKEEIDKCSDFDYTILTGTKGQRIKKMASDTDFHILNFEGVLVLKDYLKDRFGMVVLDESSRIKSHQAKRTKVILKLFKKVEFKYILTGTPVTQSPLDIFCQYKFLNENYLGFRSYYSFRNYYAIMGGYGSYQVVGYKNLEELKGKISAHSTQLKKEDCLQLPGKIYTKRIIEMTKELDKQYREMQENLIVEISEDRTLTASIILTKILRLQQILSGAYVKKNPKIEELKQIMTDNPGNRFVIWARFRDSISEIEKCLSVPYGIIHGDIKDTDRLEQRNKFRRGDVNVFIGQIRTGGLGINLTPTNHNSPSTIVIFFENNFSLEDRIQAEDRMHRYGLNKPVTYIDLIYESTIDEMVFRAISNKQDIAHEVVECFKGGKYK